MTTYYVGSGGSDAAAGTSYGARWLTVGKALGAAGIASGDTVYLAPGTYREVVTAAMTSATVETFVIGDVDGSHTSGVPGEVVWTAYLTDDVTAASATTLLNLAGRDYLTFRNLHLVSNNYAVDLTNGGAGPARNITLTDCFIQGVVWGGDAWGLSVAANLLIDRCRLMYIGGVCLEVAGNKDAADYNIGITVRDSVLMCLNGSGIYFDGVGAGAGLPGGLIVRNCTFFGRYGISVTALSTSIPSLVENCFLYVGVVALEATVSGQLVENYNLIRATTPRTNVATGANSSTVAAPMIEMGHELVVGRYARPMFTPMIGSPLLGFGGATTTATDLLGRPRPAGGQIVGAAGALERHDTAVREAGTTDAGGVAIAIAGRGDHDFYIPINAASTVITVRAQYDTNHAATNKPQAILVANPEIGITTETKTMTAAVDTWETLTFAAQTPTAKGVVIIRLVSRSAATNGSAFFDTVTVV